MSEPGEPIVRDRIKGLLTRRLSRLSRLQVLGGVVGDCNALSAKFANDTIPNFRVPISVVIRVKVVVR